MTKKDKKRNKKVVTKQTQSETKTHKNEKNKKLNEKYLFLGKLSFINLIQSLTYGHSCENIEEIPIIFVLGSINLIISSISRPFPRRLYFGILKILFKFLPAASIPFTSISTSASLHMPARYANPIGGVGSVPASPIGAIRAKIL